MAYETNSALNPNDLLDKIRTFLVAQGWTQDLWVLEGANRRLHLHKGAWFLNAKASADGSNIWYSQGYPACSVGLNLGTALNTGNAWWDQAGAVVLTSTGKATGAATPLPAGAIVEYHFFYDPTYDTFAAWIQVATGVWRWIAFGLDMVKAGTWTGGAWITGCADAYYLNYGNDNIAGHGVVNAAVYPLGVSSDATQGAPSVFVRCDVDSFVGKWVGCSSNAATGKQGATSVRGYSDVSNAVPWNKGLVDRTRNAMNSLSALLPVHLYVDRDAGGKSLIGSLPGVYTANNSGLVTAQAYALGPDSFVPFPADSPTRGSVIKKV